MAQARRADSGSDGRGAPPADKGADAVVGAKAEDMPSDGNAVDAGRDTTDGGPLIESGARGGSAGT